MNIEIVPAKIADIPILRAELRSWERDFSQRFGLPAILEDSIEDPEGVCWTAWTDGRITGIGGVKAGSLLCGEGYLWWAGAKEVEDNTPLGNLVIAKHMRLFVDEAKDRFPALWGHVVHEQPNAVKFTRWLGFQVEAPEPLRGLHVSKFWWRR